MTVLNINTHIYLPYSYSVYPLPRKSPQLKLGIIKSSMIKFLKMYHHILFKKFKLKIAAFC